MTVDVAVGVSVGVPVGVGVVVSTADAATATSVLDRGGVAGGPIVLKTVQRTAAEKTPKTNPTAMAIILNGLFIFHLPFFIVLLFLIYDSV